MSKKRLVDKNGQDEIGSGKPQFHQNFQVLKIEVLNRIRQFWGVEFPLHWKVELKRLTNHDTYRHYSKNHRQSHNEPLDLWLFDAGKNVQRYFSRLWFDGDLLWNQRKNHLDKNLSRWKNTDRNCRMIWVLDHQNWTVWWAGFLAKMRWFWKGKPN